MKELEFKEISGWSNKEIDVKIAELEKFLFNSRMQKVTSGIEKPHQLKIAKKNVAKLLTAKNAKGN